MSKNIEKKFEEEYFEGYYKRAVGSFTKKDLEISKNWFWAWLAKLDQYVPIEKGNGRSVLEIGCSIGAVSNILAERGFEVIASDVSQYVLAKAAKLTPNVRFVKINVEKEINLKKKFDIIIAFEVVEHLENPEKGIYNMYKALKKQGGILVFSTPYPYKWNFNDPTHINVRYPKEWIGIMKKVGLKDIEYHRFSLLPFFYRFNRHFQIIIPFAVPIPYINSPIFFIGKRDEK